MRVAAISLDDAADASLGRASVLLHPEASIAIGSTAESRRNLEYECTWERRSKGRRPGAETLDRRVS
jgi:hypothetical protein